MKFSSSQRRLHPQNKYTPACNEYTPSLLVKQSKVVTGSLEGPSLVEKGSFAMARRFKANSLINNNPGPASYNHTIDNKKDKLDKSKSRIKKGKLKDAVSTPSIPFNYYGKDGDEDEKKYIDKLLLNEDISRSNKIVMKQPCTFSFPKSQRNPSFIPKPDIPQPRYQNILNQNQIIDQVAKKQNQHLRQTNIIWREKIQKSTQRRKQIINLINPQYTPSLELIELISKRRQKVLPGPADYFSKKQHPHVKVCPFSQVKRFPLDTKTIIGPGLYQPNIIKSTQKGFSFNRSQKQLFKEQIKNVNSNFRFYINPDQPKSKNNLISNLSSAFGSGTVRFSENDNKSQISQPIAKNQTTSFMKKIKMKQKHILDDKQQGLLGISTMVSTID